MVSGVSCLVYERRCYRRGLRGRGPRALDADAPIAAARQPCLTEAFIQGTRLRAGFGMARRPCAAV